jgi:hypothetical protein
LFLLLARASLAQGLLFGSQHDQFVTNLLSII